MGDIREEYLRWLYPQLRDSHAPQDEFWGLTTLMFDTEFTWTVAHDDNRIQDGLALREEWGSESGVRSHQLHILGECSFLEVHIGLSRRLSFTAGGEAPGWAWALLTNLELHRLKDPFTRRKQIKAEEIMETVIQRRYSPDGSGGFFPLAWPDDDQTTVELWYQLNAYVGEMHSERGHG